VEFVQLDLGRIVPLQVQHLLQMGEYRREGTVLVIRRTAKLQAGCPGLHDPLLDLLHQARLADAGLTTEQYNLAITGLGRCPTLQD
jgi:hypothetical protein